MCVYVDIFLLVHVFVLHYCMSPTLAILPPLAKMLLRKFIHFEETEVSYGKKIMFVMSFNNSCNIV